MPSRVKDWFKQKWQETDLFVNELVLGNPTPQEVIADFKALHATTDRTDAEMLEFVTEMCNAPK